MAMRCVLWRRRAPGQNMLILGAQTEVRNRMLASALAALPTMVRASELDVVLIDGLRDEMPGGGMLRFACEELHAAGVQVTVTNDAGAGPVLATLAKQVQSSTHAGRSCLVVIAEPEYLYSIHGGADRFAPPTGGPAADLRTVLSRGPQDGVHTIVTAAGLSALGAILAPSWEARLFNHRIVQQMNEDESMSLFASLVAARINEQTDHPFASMMIDQVQGPRSNVLFHAYAAQRNVNADQGLDSLQAELSRLSSR